jgi:hypothetical protein
MMEAVGIRVIDFFVRAWYTISDVYTTCRRGSTSYHSDVWELHSFTDDQSHYTATREEVHTDSEVYTVLFHHTRREGSDGTTSYRIAVHWDGEARDTYRIRDLYDQPIPRWFYVGYIDDDGKKVDCTGDASVLVVSGNKVTIPVLEHIVGGGARKRWVYMDTTFNEHDFPSEGIIIGSDGDTEQDTHDDAPPESREGGVEVQ